MISVRSSVRDTQGRSRVPELGPLGSMRGASSNGRPYRERKNIWRSIRPRSSAWAR